MADNTSVNDQITDAVTQTNVKVVGDAPTEAMGNLFDAQTQEPAIAALHEANNQEENDMTAQATTTEGVVTLYSIDTASTGKPSNGLNNGPVKE